MTFEIQLAGRSLVRSLFGGSCRGGFLGFRMVTFFKAAIRDFESGGTRVSMPWDPGNKVVGSGSDLLSHRRVPRAEDKSQGSGDILLGSPSLCSP